jgi:hypothetical protein
MKLTYKLGQIQQKRSMPAAADYPLNLPKPNPTQTIIKGL